MDFLTNQRNAVIENYWFVNITITVSHYLLHLWWSYYVVYEIESWPKKFSTSRQKAKLLVLLQGLNIQAAKLKYTLHISI